MKNFSLILICFLLFQNQKIKGQVTIYESPYIDQQISIPITDLGFAEYQIKSDSTHTYLLIDTCTMEFVCYQSGTFTSQSLRKIQLFINGELRMMQMFLPQGAIWQFYPMQYFGFPQGEPDSALFTFVCEIPDTTEFVPQTVGEFLRTKLMCKYHFADNTFQSFQTNNEIGQTLTVSGITSNVEELNSEKIPVVVSENKILIYESGVKIRNTLGQQLNKEIDSEIFVPSGFYYWEQGDKKKGKIIVY